MGSQLCQRDEGQKTTCTRRRVTHADSKRLARSRRRSPDSLRTQTASLRSVHWCCNQDSCRTREHHTRFVLAVLKGLKNEIDSSKAIGSMEVGVTCEEPNVLELVEYTEELLDVFDSIRGIRLDPKLLKVSRHVELDFMSRLGVYRKRPRTWATDRGIPVVPTKWVDVNKGDAKQPEYRSR